MPLYGKFPLMGSISLWEMPLYGKCPLWEVPLDGRCPLIGGAPLWQVPDYGRCPYIEGAPLWEVAHYGRHPMEIHGKCTFMGDILIRCSPSCKVSLWKLSCLFTGGTTL